METQHTWIDDRLPTEDDVNEYGHIIKPDRQSTKGWYPCDTQGMELGDPWARILTMPIWVRSNPYPLMKKPTQPPLLNYWNKPSDFPTFCWLMTADDPNCFLVCNPGVILARSIRGMSEYKWMSHPFDNFDEGAPCNKPWK